jgi:serine/threonine protein kinase
MIGKTISHYRIPSQLGGGGMGVVCEAEDLKLHRHVALKFLPIEMENDPAARERFAPMRSPVISPGRNRRSHLGDMNQREVLSRRVLRTNLQPIEDWHGDRRRDERHHHEHGEQRWRKHMSVVGDIQHNQFHQPTCV